jgi:hypothetical protein
MRQRSDIGPRSRLFLLPILAPTPARSHVKSCPLIDKICHFSTNLAYAALRKIACLRAFNFVLDEKMDEAIFTFMNFKFPASGLC